MSTFSGITVDSSAGLGIDLYPEDAHKASSIISDLDTLNTTTQANHHTLAFSNHTHSVQYHQKRNRAIYSSTSETSAHSLPMLNLGAENSSSDLSSTSSTMRHNSKSRTKLKLDGFVNNTSKRQHRKIVTQQDTASRGRILTSGSPIQTAEELKCVLGNAHSRLKSRATITSGILSNPNTSRSGTERILTLEQAKSRSRVNLDILLESDICVQGGTMQGNIQIYVKKYPKNCPTLISGGKLKVIGFESSENDLERSVFYQCSAPLSKTTSGLERLFSSDPDEDGFSLATEGVHFFPFALNFTPSLERGIAKGTISAQNGIAIHYVAILFVALKDQVSGEQSIAHFYRECKIWPRFNPSTVLAPTSRPIQVTESLHLAGNCAIKLTASLHRLHWVSGQHCFVGIQIVNHSKKPVKNVSIRLIRSTTVFRVGYKFDRAGDGRRNGKIADVLQASTTVAQSNMDVCAQGTRGHASAKGWWAGVNPGHTRSFTHRILIPVDASSVSRGKFFAVSYGLQIFVNVGTLLATEVQVSLPIEIINFLSIDPPASSLSNSMYLSQSTSSPVSTPEFPSHLEEDSCSKDEGYSSGYESHELSSSDEYGDASDMEFAMPTPGQVGKPSRFADLYHSSIAENFDKDAAQSSRYKGQQQDGELKASESQSSNPKNTFSTRVKEKYLQREAHARNHPNPWDETSGSIIKGVSTDSETSLLSQSSTPSKVSFCLPTSSMRNTTTYTPGDHSSSTDDSQGPCPCDMVESKGFYPRTPRGNHTPGCEGAMSNSISGVPLLDGHQRSYWKTPKPSQPEDASQPEVRRKALPAFPNNYSNNYDGKIGRAVQQTSDSMGISQSSTYTITSRHTWPPTEPSVGSVKYKIRELELVANAAAEVFMHDD